MLRENEYFSRIEPVLGHGLSDKRVAWVGLEICAPVLELLAACRLRRFSRVQEAEQSQQLEQKLRQHNHFEEGWEFKPFSEVELPDLVIAGGSVHSRLVGLELAEKWGIPAVLFGALPVQHEYEAILLICRPYTNLEAERRFLKQLPETGVVLGQEVTTMVAAVAKALLLQGTPYAHADYDYLFERLGRRVLLMGTREWPWQVRYSTLESEAKKVELTNLEIVNTSSARSVFSILKAPVSDHHVAIFGCGGLGSLITKELNVRGVSHFSLVDGGSVNIFHPIRQFYHTSQIDQPKVYALAENLIEEKSSYRHFPSKIGQPRIYQGSKTIASYNLKLNDNWLNSLKQLVAHIEPDLAIITTGTTLDFYLARAFQRAGKPYVVARCYPRARYFELIFSLPNENTPCFDCIRGHLYIGPEPGLTVEEQARYENRQAVTLEAEPATLVETSYAAGVAARLGMEMLKQKREKWFQNLVKGGQTCLLGANQTERTMEGWAYGLHLPGQVAAFGLDQLFEFTGQIRKCATCGRTNQPVYKAQVEVG